MGKKKFIDKKNSATFQLLARDSSFPAAPAAPSSPTGPAADRVFVRVDNNPHYAAPGSFAEGDDPDDHGGHDADLGDDEADPYSIFADAPEDTDDEDAEGRGPPPAWGGPRAARPCASPLPDHVRKDILELGLPDDGYNYLVHLREIRKAGGGSNYYENSKARLDKLPLDVRAYDASSLRLISEVVEDGGGDSIYDVAAKTVGVKVEKVVDPDVVRLLDDGDLSRFGSDVEDLEEDFVVMANRVEEGEEEGISGSRSVSGSAMPPFKSVASENDESLREEALGFGSHVESRRSHGEGEAELRDNQKQRPRRPLDEQFDQLMLHEYGDDSDNDDAGYMDNNEESFAANIKDAMKKYPEDEFEFEEKYKVPADFVCHGQVASSNLLVESSADVMQRCVVYAQMYSQEDAGDEKVVIFEESSDESEVWDCETIISTYSNLDNHPGRIQAPEKPRRRPQFSESISKLPSEKSKIISLAGKEVLPVDFLPHSRRGPVEKVKKSVSSEPDQQKRRPNESKEEKKERKAAVREARREARQAKKELKGLYKCEAQLAQKVAAISGPSSIRLM
ncbi:hypothetical protein Taro_049679 [Colocasia esculenta]|uniref:Protein LTV1 homolog n=1 Tax=Colocasia esculenta TaxID=4460 RepID=A0A843XBF1_COLES|nr:hypothetical protein [Colocasia esculenta]